MFDTMIETRRAGTRTRAMWPYPVAASMHFLVVGGTLAASLLALQRAPEFESPFPPVFVTSVELGTGPSAPPPLGEGGPSRNAPAVIPRERPATPQEIVQPREVPPAAPAPAGSEDTIEESIPGLSRPGLGVPGLDGDGTGWPWGVEGGLGDGPGGGLVPGDERVEPSGPPAPVEVTPDMVSPVLVRKVKPDYPALARAARLPGFVLLQAVVGEDGCVEDVKVLQASSPLFGDAAVEAVRQWKYRPALQSGRPVRVYFSVRVEFQLK
jgi:protein TonB